MAITELGFVHRFVPAHSNDPVTFLVLHGTGGDENDLVPLAQSIRPSAGILSPRGKISENGLNRFFRRISPGEFDLKDLHNRTKELAGFVKNACAQYKMDSRQVVALGYSNGANTAANLLLNYPDTLCAAVLFRALLPDTPRQTPNLNGKKILVLSGKKDSLILPSQTKELMDYLKKTGARVTEHALETGHQLANQDIQIAREWMEKEFKKAD